MSLVTDLGLTVREPNLLAKGIRAIAQSRPGAWLFSKSLHHLDELTGRIGGGRFSVTEVAAQLPLVELTCKGARSGAERTTPLVAIPFNDVIAVIGSGWGQQDTPAWVFNLRANPQATVSHHGREIGVVARELFDGERDHALAAAIGVYLGYAEYPRRARHRHIAVFALEST